MNFIKHLSEFEFELIKFYFNYLFNATSKIKNQNSWEWWLENTSPIEYSEKIPVILNQQTSRNMSNNQVIFKV